MTSQQPKESKKQFSLIPCSVCGSSSSGFHFGAISCESCKVFFCRSMKRPCVDEESKAPYVHRCTDSTTPTSALLNCQRCRFDKCLAAGMSISAICIGRHSAERRLQKTKTLTSLAEKNKLLVTGNVGKVHSFVQDGAKRKKAANPEFAAQQKKEVVPKESKEEAVKDLTTQVPDVQPSSNFVSVFNESRLLPQHCSLLEKLVERAVASIDYLHEIRTMPNVGIVTPDMPSDVVWATMMGGHDAYVNIIRTYVKSLPGFSTIASLTDRIRLFNGAFHPIYSTQLSQEFDVVNQVPKFYSISPGISQRVALDRFPEFIDMWHQLTDSGVAVTSAQFTRAEMALLCALIVFNPNSQLIKPRPDDGESSSLSNEQSTTTSEMADQKRVQMISARYWQATEQFIRRTFSPETATRRLLLFSELLNYFRNTTLLCHQISVSLPEKYPFITQPSRIFADVVAKLLADRSDKKYLRHFEHAMEPKCNFLQKVDVKPELH